MIVKLYNTTWLSMSQYKINISLLELMTLSMTLPTDGYIKSLNIVEIEML